MATDAFIHVFAAPTSCKEPLRNLANYSTVVGQMSIGGHVEDLESAAYDFGGNHHNDSFSFVYEGDKYNFYHSSIGYGWRACHNMDCLQVSAGAGTAVTDDGCTADRTIPEVCSKIELDGTYEELSVDTFEWCPGDPNHS